MNLVRQLRPIFISNLFLLGVKVILSCAQQKEKRKKGRLFSSPAKKPIIKWRITPRSAVNRRCREQADDWKVPPWAPQSSISNPASASDLSISVCGFSQNLCWFSLVLELEDQLTWKMTIGIGLRSAIACRLRILRLRIVLANVVTLFSLRSVWPTMVLFLRNANLWCVWENRAGS